MYYRHLNFYSNKEKPIDNVLFLYFNFISFLKKARGIRIFNPENLEENVYLHIPDVIRIFCFRDWFNTRVDIEIGYVLSADFFHEIAKLVKYTLNMNQSVDIDYDIIFFDMRNKINRKRIDIEKTDSWRDKR